MIRSLGVLGLAALLGSGLSAPAALAAEPITVLQPVHGFDPLVRLAPDSEGEDVERLQQALSDAGFYRQAVDGVFGLETALAVVAFHKYLGLDRTSTWSALDWIRLRMLPASGIPDRHDEPDRVEVDLERQLVFIIREHQVEGVLHTSTGGNYTYFSPRNGRNVEAATPRGDFTLRWRQYGWVCDQATGWCVYNYWAFADYYGIHGYLSVPAVASSHGCVRVTTWDSDWLDDKLFVGMPVHIWDQPPIIAPPPFDPEYEPDRAGAIAV